MACESSSTANKGATLIAGMARVMGESVEEASTVPPQEVGVECIRGMGRGRGAAPVTTPEATLEEAKPELTRLWPVLAGGAELVRSREVEISLPRRGEKASNSSDFFSPSIITREAHESQARTGLGLGGCCTLDIEQSVQKSSPHSLQFLARLNTTLNRCLHSPHTTPEALGLSTGLCSTLSDTRRLPLLAETFCFLPSSSARAHSLRLSPLSNSTTQYF